MIYFANLDSNNVVLQVIVIDRQHILDANGVEQEELGIQYCQQLLGGVWKQISNHNFPPRYPNEGYTYNPELDVFVPPKPYNSWVLNTDIANWVAPIPAPSNEHTWNEEMGAWE